MLMCKQNLVKLYPLVLKILSGNEIVISIKGGNSVAILRNLTLYNPNLDIINVNVHIIWLNSVHWFSSYCTETKFLHQSRAVTLLQTCKPEDQWSCKRPAHLISVPKISMFC